MKALLVVDMQEVCVGENHAEFFKYDNLRLISGVNQAIDENEGNIIIYIQNLMKRNVINKFAPFEAYEGTKEVELVKELHIASDFVFTKYAGDAFSNPKLDEFLKSKEVDTIEVIGVDGGGRVALTAMGAVKRDYKVIVNTKAIDTVYEKNRDKFFKKLREQGATFL